MHCEALQIFTAGPLFYFAIPLLLEVILIIIVKETIKRMISVKALLENVGTGGDLIETVEMELQPAQGCVSDKI